MRIPLAMRTRNEDASELREGFVCLVMIAMCSSCLCTINAQRSDSFMSTKNKAGFTTVLAGRETVVHWQRDNTRTKRVLTN